MAIDLTTAQFKVICGKRDAEQLSNGSDSVLEDCLNRSKIKVKSYFLRADVAYSETEDITSSAVMYSAIYLLYQRADISSKATAWRKEAYEALESILGETVSEDYQERDKKAPCYCTVIEDDSYDDYSGGLVEW